MCAILLGCVAPAPPDVGRGCGLSPSVYESPLAAACGVPQYGSDRDGRVARPYQIWCVARYARLGGRTGFEPVTFRITRATRYQAAPTPFVTLLLAEPRKTEECAVRCCDVHAHSRSLGRRVGCVGVIPQHTGYGDVAFEAHRVL